MGILNKKRIASMQSTTVLTCIMQSTAPYVKGLIGLIFSVRWRKNSFDKPAEITNFLENSYKN